MPDPLTLDQRVARLERRDAASDQAGRRLLHRAVLVIVAVAMVAAFGTWRAEHAVAGLTEETHDRLVRQCEQANEFRLLFREYLRTQGAGADPQTALELPGYTALDPATRDYVRALVEVLDLSRDGAARLRREYVRKFPLQDCSAIP